MSKTFLSKLSPSQRKKTLAISIVSIALVLIILACFLLLPSSGSVSSGGTPGTTTNSGTGETNSTPTVTGTGSSNTENNGNTSTTSDTNNTGSATNTTGSGISQNQGAVQNEKAFAITKSFVEKEKIQINTAKPTYAADMPTTTLKMENGMPRLRIDNQLTAPILFFGNSDYANPNGVTTSQAGFAGDADIHLHSIIVNISYGANIDTISAPAMKIMYNDLEKDIKSITDGDPDAKILLRVSLLMKPTSSTPKSEIMAFKDTSVSSNRVSIASNVYNEESSRRLAHLVDYISSNAKLSKHIIGYHLDNQEWFPYGYREYGHDYSTANNKKFAEWLTVKYKTDAELQKAWGDKTATLSTAVVPKEMPGNPASENYSAILYYGTLTQKYVDYHQYINDLTVARLSNFARIIKERTDNRSLVISFYGYHFELPCSLSGHYNLNWLLQDKNIDGFAGPVTYEDRNVNSKPKSGFLATSAYMSTVDSIQRNGKLWFQESDQRTFINHTEETIVDRHLPPLKSLEEIYEVHKREIGGTILHGNGFWAMDLQARGWLDDASIWKNLGKLRNLYSTYQNGQKNASQFDVALVVDEYSLHRIATQTAVGYDLLSQMRLNLYHAGLSTCYVQLKDVLAGKVNDAKLYIIVSAFDMTDDQITQLQKQLHKDGKTSLFMYNFGNMTNAQAKALTGMDFADVKKVSDTKLTMSNQSVVPGLTSANHTAVTARAMSVVGGQTATLGTYSDGSVGFAIKQEKNYTTIYYGDSLISVANLKAIARACGINVYTDTEDVFMANQNMAVLQAVQAGNKTVSFGKKVDVYDYFEGKWYTGVDKITLSMKQGQTKYLFFGTKSEIEGWKLPKF